MTYFLVGAVCFALGCWFGDWLDTRDPLVNRKSPLQEFDIYPGANAIRAETNRRIRALEKALNEKREASDDRTNANQT